MRALGQIFLIPARRGFLALFGRDNSLVAARKLLEPDIVLSNLSQKTIYLILRVGNLGRIIERLFSDLIRERSKSYWERAPVQAEGLHRSLDRIFDMPQVEIEDNQPVRVNVLVPAFSIESISAGFFGVFNFSLFLERIGFRVRLVLFDTFPYFEDSFRQNLKGYPDFHDLFDRCEVAYIGDRTKPLTISAFDSVVATVWYSAYFARKISDLTRRPFLYLIQDYEAAFYPNSSSQVLARQTYDFDYHGLVSTRPLHDFFLDNVPGFAEKRTIWFNNAAAVNNKRLGERANSSRKTFVFYSRPAVNRNMFELSALAVIEAISRGVFSPLDNWEFLGMGLGDVEIDAGSGVRIKQVRRMSLAEYRGFLPRIDVALSLMASPHPSIVPFDIAGSGGMVVTNSFEAKTPAYFAEISDRIICTEANLEALVEGLNVAVNRADELASSGGAVSPINYPTRWEDVWTEGHEFFVEQALASSGNER